MGFNGSYLLPDSERGPVGYPKSTGGCIKYDQLNKMQKMGRNLMHDNPSKSPSDIYLSLLYVFSAPTSSLFI